MCTVELPCGHCKRVICCNRDSVNRKCEEQINIILPCGHSRRVMCFQRNYTRLRCFTCENNRNAYEMR